MHPTYERLLEAFLQIHRLFRPADIARHLNVSSSVLGNWKSRGVPPDRVYEIAKLVGTSSSYIIEGKLPIRVSPSSNTQNESDDAESRPQLLNLTEHPDLVSVPRVRFKLSAGVSGYAVEHDDGNGKPVFFRKDWFDRNGFAPSSLFAVLVSGSSMEPSLWDGDLVVVNTSDCKPHDGDVFAINYEGELVIKRMCRDSGQWFAASDNADQRRFAPKRCTDDVKIIGKVVYKQSERI